MIKTITRLLAVMVFTGWANISNATPIGYDIGWIGSNGYSLEGSFSFDDSLLNSGSIDGSSLLSFMIEGFQGTTSVGSWDFFSDGLASSFSFNFNFDTTAETFLVGGNSASGTGQLWNTTSGGRSCNTFGFGSGASSQALCVTGSLVGGSFIDVSNSTLTASRASISTVPEPATLVMFALGLVGVSLVQRKKA